MGSAPPGSGKDFPGSDFILLVGVRLRRAARSGDDPERPEPFDGLVEGLVALAEADKDTPKMAGRNPIAPFGL
jgi:hypothetical protein